jgi:hypothetical protein
MHVSPRASQAAGPRHPLRIVGWAPQALQAPGCFLPVNVHTSCESYVAVGNQSHACLWLACPCTCQIVNNLPKKKALRLMVISRMLAAARFLRSETPVHGEVRDRSGARSCTKACLHTSCGHSYMAFKHIAHTKRGQ